MGSILRLPIIEVRDVATFIMTCKQKEYQTIATTLTGDKTHFDIDLTRPTAIILGQEGAGLPKEITDHIDLQVRIPMAETIDSLNVATAAAVILYEAMRQRLRK